MDRGYNDYALFNKWTQDGVFFVTRLKDNASFEALSETLVKPGGKILSDRLIRLDNPKALRECRAHLSLVTVSRDDEEIVFLTNNYTLSYFTISEIYKDRWDIEIFFKTIKQNLKIKSFVGTSPNVLEIQIWTALTAILLLKYLQFKARLSWSFSNLVALVRRNLFCHHDLWTWLDDPGGIANCPEPSGMYQPLVDSIFAK